MPRVLRQAFPAAVLSVVLCACAGGASSVSSPADTAPPASATAEATPDVLPSVAGSSDDRSPSVPQSIQPDTIARVLVTDLVVRTAPGTGANSTILEERLREPQLLYVADGPVPSDGYQWYLVATLSSDQVPQDPDIGGWVAAASRDDEPWITAAELECPTPDIDAISGMHPLARLACYGGRTLTLEGNDGGCFVADPVSVSPAWLSSSGCALNPDGHVGGGRAGSNNLVLRQRPGIVWDDYQPGLVTHVIVRGHFDDPAARTCAPVPESGYAPLIPELLVLSCRAEFAAMEVRGTS